MFAVTAPNATEAERPFYRMVLRVTRILLLQVLASVLSFHVRFQILDSSYHLISVDGSIEGKATEYLAS